VLEQLASAGIIADGRRARVFERRFVDLKDKDESPVIGMYSDRGQDPEAEWLLEDLRRVVAAAVPAGNRINYELRFLDGINLQDAEHAKYLRQLLDDLCTAGLKAIDEARASPTLRTEKDHLVEESAFHLTFAAERARRFSPTGPSGAALERVTEYLNGRGGKAMVVYGPSGAGKTYVGAKAVGGSKIAMVVRFLGTSRDSAAVAPMLFSVCKQLQVISMGRGGFIADGSSSADRLGPVPPDFDALCVYFKNALAEWHWGTLLLLLDSVDQLDDTNSGRRLEWLPLEFSDQVHT
jgi:hypothetical protein